jgi:hypothetical protein
MCRPRIRRLPASPSIRSMMYTSQPGIAADARNRASKGRLGHWLPEALQRRIIELRSVLRERSGERRTQQARWLRKLLSGKQPPRAAHYFAVPKTRQDVPPVARLPGLRHFSQFLSVGICRSSRVTGECHYEHNANRITASIRTSFLMASSTLWHLTRSKHKAEPSFAC